MKVYRKARKSPHETVERRGFQDRMAGLSLDKCPYEDHRTARGSVTGSRGYIKAWIRGWRKANNDILATARKYELSIIMKTKLVNSARMKRIQAAALKGNRRAQLTQIAMNKTRSAIAYRNGMKRGRRR